MTPSLLTKYLDSYDRLTPDTAHPIPQQSILHSLRILSKSPQTMLDITTPVQRLISSVHPSQPWETQSSFEKLLTILSGHATPQEQQAFLLGKEEQWLHNVIANVQSQLGGAFTLTPSETSLQLKLTGPLTMKYSVFMALLSSKLIDNQHLDTQHIDADLDLTIHVSPLTDLIEKTRKLNHVKLFLTQLGFDVSTGTKTCAQSLSQNPAYQSRHDVELKRDFGISLTIGDALRSTPDLLLIFPLTLKITTTSDALMEQLESYYAHPLVNLNSRDGKRKTFIEETRRPGLLHESVLNFNQLDALSDFFDRIAFFSNYRHEAIGALTESTMLDSTRQVYKKIRDSIALAPSSFDITRHSQPTSDTGRMEMIAFEQYIEQRCKSTMIPGPTLFSGHDFINAFQAIQHDIFQSEAYVQWPTFKEEYEAAPNCRTPASPLPIAHYAKALALHHLVGSHKQNISANLREHQDGIAWLNKTLDRALYGAAADQHYLDFYTKNNAYFLLDSLVSCIKISLDHPRCSEKHVEDMLRLLSLTPEAMAFCQHTVGEQRYFNRFQIKLFLLPLVLHALHKEQLLLDFNGLRSRQDPWISYTTSHGSQRNYASTIQEWCKVMIGWKTANAINGLNWIPSTERAASETRYREETTQRDRMFAGGAKADEQKEAKAAEKRTTVNYGSCG